MTSLKDSRIYVAGHRGLVGSAIWRHLEAAGFTDLVGRTRAELDLRDRGAVVDVLRRERPDVRRAGRRQGRRHPRQRHLAGRVPLRQPAHPGQRDGRRARAPASSACCSSAPAASTRKFADQPIREDSLLTGAARADQRRLRDRQDRRHHAGAGAAPRSTALTASPRCRPTSTARATTSTPRPPTCCRRLIRRFHEAAQSGAAEVVALGHRHAAPRVPARRRPGRARACTLLEHYDDPRTINVGVGEDVTIRELAEIVAEIVGYRRRDRLGHRQAGRHAPQAARRRHGINALGWRPEIGLARRHRADL